MSWALYITRDTDDGEEGELSALGAYDTLAAAKRAAQIYAGTKPLPWVSGLPGQHIAVIDMHTEMVIEQEEPC